MNPTTLAGFEVTARGRIVRHVPGSATTEGFDLVPIARVMRLPLVVILVPASATVSLTGRDDPSEMIWRSIAAAPLHTFLAGFDLRATGRVGRQMPGTANLMGFPVTARRQLVRELTPHVAVGTSGFEPRKGPVRIIRQLRGTLGTNTMEVRGRPARVMQLAQESLFGKQTLLADTALVTVVSRDAKAVQIMHADTAVVQFVPLIGWIAIIVAGVARCRMVALDATISHGTITKVLDTATVTLTGPQPTVRPGLRVLQPSPAAVDVAVQAFAAVTLGVVTPVADTALVQLLSFDLEHPGVTIEPAPATVILAGLTPALGLGAVVRGDPAALTVTALDPQLQLVRLTRALDVATVQLASLTPAPISSKSRLFADTARIDLPCFDASVTTTSVYDAGKPSTSVVFRRSGRTGVRLHPRSLA